MRPTRWIWVLALALGCGRSGEEPDYAYVFADHEHPPVGAMALEAWLAEGFYKSWSCEPIHHPELMAGAEQIRICSNPTASHFDGRGEYPVGTASVKEMYHGDEIVGYAVTRHLSPGGCDTYYYYERLGPNSWEGQPHKDCLSCHDQAGTTLKGHDCLFNQIRPTEP